MNAELLAQLDDILLPPAVGWWPLAGSVWMTLITLLGIGVGLGWYFWRRHQLYAYRRHALHQLQQLNALSPQDDQAWLSQMNALLKQVAITVYGRQACAGLNHQAWLSFLKNKAGFIEQPEAMQRLEQRYHANALSLSAAEREAILYYARQWIQEHHL